MWGRRAVHQCSDHCGYRRVHVGCLAHLLGKGDDRGNHGLPHESHDGPRGHYRDRQVPGPSLVSGMGDALATYFEADMCHRTASPCLQTNAPSTRTARVLGRLVFDLLMEHGVQAKAEAEAGLAGPGIEAIVEANVLLSGLGFESGGLSASHAVGQAFHCIKNGSASASFTASWWPSAPSPSFSWRGESLSSSIGFSGSAGPWGCRPRSTR